MDFITAPLVTLVVFVTIYGIFDLMVRRRERMAIIEKMGDKLDPALLNGKLDIVGFAGKRFSFGALKAGCLLVGVGLGILIGFIICVNTIPGYTNFHEGWNSNRSEVTSIIYGASVLTMGGIGLIAAFLIEMKTGKK